MKFFKNWSWATFFKWLLALITGFIVVIKWPVIAVCLAAMNGPSVGDPVFDVLIDLGVAALATIALGIVAEAVVLAVAVTLAQFFDRMYQRYRLHKALSKAWAHS